MRTVHAVRYASLAIIAASALRFSGRRGFEWRAAGDPRQGSGLQSPRRQVRVLLSAPRDEGSLSATVPWTLLDRDRRVIARGQSSETWLIQREPGRVRTV